MQHTVCIESICTIQTSLHTQCTLGWDSVFRTCIEHCAFLRLFFWPLLPIGRVIQCTCILHRYLSALSWLWVSFRILHPAHPARLSQL